MQVAYKLLKKGIHPQDIALFEMNPFPGEHSSSRNSGVLHAGLYYPANSKKQDFCLKGNFLWEELGKEIGFRVTRPGKYLVASSKAEIEELEKLYEFARSKEVPGLKWSDGTEIKSFVNLEKTFFSTSTGVVSTSEVIQSFRNYLERKGVLFLLNQKVEHIQVANETFEVFVGDEKIRADFVVNTAGLFGINIRKKLGLNDLEDYWVKGRYLKLNKKFFNKSLIYPLPPAGLTGLGVHTSFDLDGIVRFGPDTEEVKKIDYNLSTDLIDEQFPSINKLFSGIQKSDLSLDYAGIRSKIVHKGEIFKDFWIENPIPKYWETLGIESPGLTASPAIADFLVSNMLK